MMRTLTLAAATIAAVAALLAAGSPARADTPRWGQALDAARITKDDLEAQAYQYPPIGNGGLTLMPGPTGLPDVQPPDAPYAPVLSYDGWWNDGTARVQPFTLEGGYFADGDVEPGIVDDFEQDLDVATGTLTSRVHMTPPPPPAPALSLEGSRWIWFPAGAPAGDMPAGDAFFLTTIDVPEDAAIASAGAEVTSDDAFTMYVNGTRVANGDNWQKPKVANVFHQLHPGTNTIAIRAHNVTGPAGLIGAIRVDLTDGRSLSFATGDSWRTSLDADPGWQEPGYDASSWTAALDQGAFGEGPWGTRLDPPSEAAPAPAPDAPGSFDSARTELVTPDGVLAIRITDSVAHRVALHIGAQPGFQVAHTGGAARIVATTDGNGGDPMALAAAVSGSDVSVDAGSGTLLARVAPDDPVTFYVAAGGREAAAPARAAEEKVAGASRRDFAAARAACARFWKRFWGASSISLPDPELMKWYVRNQYYLGAFMANGHVPQGVDGARGGPAQYMGNPDLEYDGVYNFLALLTANQPAISQVTADWVERSLPAAERLAHFYTYDGQSTPGAAMYAWLAGFDGEETTQFGPSPVENDWQAYPSANAALIDLLQARFTDDPDRMERAQEILVKVTRHQLDNAAREPALDDRWVSQKFRWYYGPANGFVKGAVPDQAALLWSLREASRLGVGPPEWRDYAENVYLPIAIDEARGEQALTGYIGDTPSIANSMFVNLLPLYFFGVVDTHGPLARATVANEIASPDLYDSLLRGNAAVGAAVSGKGDDSLALLRYMIDSTNAADPGTALLWDDTYFAEGQHCGFCSNGPSSTPRLAGHSTINQAIQRMLLDDSTPSAISVFPALPSAWDESGAAFTDLLAPGGIEVSARYDRSGTSVTLRNDSAKEVTRVVTARLPANTRQVELRGGPHGPVRLHGRFAEFRETIPPHATRKVTLTPSATGTWRTVDDASPSITYSAAPGWSVSDAAAGWIDGTAHYTANAGATAELTFDGTAVQVIGDRAPDHGQFRVYLDAELEGSFDAWQDRRTDQQVLYAAYGLSPGTHTVRVEVTGLKDSHAAASFVGLDAIRALG
jgi:hypothetical protein